MPENPNKFNIYSDEQLMQFICEGEDMAFEELFIRYNKRLLGYFFRMLNFDKSLAEDALQDVFLKIAEAPQKFKTSFSFKTWVFTIASNYCKNYYRHRQVVSENVVELKYLQNDIDESSFIKNANLIDAKKFRIKLDETLSKINPDKREAFILKYQEEKTIAEIAQIQNCPEGSVKSRLHYTLKILEIELKIFNPTY